MFSSNSQLKSKENSSQSLSFIVIDFNLKLITATKDRKIHRMNYNEKLKKQMFCKLKKSIPLLDLVENGMYTYTNTSFCRTFSSSTKTQSKTKRKYKVFSDMDVGKELRKLKRYAKDSECRVSDDKVLMAQYKFLSEEPDIYKTEFILVAFMVLLLKYVYPMLKLQSKEMGRAKFTPIYKIEKSGYYQKTTLCHAIQLTYQNGSVIPEEIVMKELNEAIQERAKAYSGNVLSALGIRVYYTGHIDPAKLAILLNKKRIFHRLLNNIYEKYQAITNIKGSVEERLTKASEEETSSKKSHFVDYIRKAKSSPKKRAFIVGDLETLFLKNADKEQENELNLSEPENEIIIPEQANEIILSEQEKQVSNTMDLFDLENSKHRAYAGGFMMVRPDTKPERSDMQLFYADEYGRLADNPEDFEEKSALMLKAFINAIIKAGKKERRVTVAYFHNLSGFDGIIMLRHLAKKLHQEIRFKTLFRNSALYSIDIKTNPKDGNMKNSRTIVKFVDSCKLLTGKLELLGQHFAPELGGKEKIEYLKVQISNLTEKKKEYLAYLEKDLLLTAAILQKAQEIYFRHFHIDITSVLTISAMGLKIFRSQYYDDSKEETRIYIPDDNKDHFIRGGYYGGHTDVYIRVGTDLKMYDVNSLYPYIMKNCEMPGGRGQWFPKLRNEKKEDMFGFVKAMVICPKDIKRPFLPYKENTGQLIFPTGLFLGVYWSEELKYAERLGYKVYPIQALQFDRMQTPFQHFIEDLYSLRLQAKKDGDDALSYVLKTTMNSLYGRFGISPESTKTEIALSKAEFDAGAAKEEFYDHRDLGNDSYVMMFKHTRRTGDIIDYIKNDLSNNAVQISAAITAYARIHMYPHISRDDCYYTDTDSVLLKAPLQMK